MLWEGTCFLALTTNYITVVFTVPNYCCQNRLTDTYVCTLLLQITRKNCNRGPIYQYDMNMLHVFSFVRPYASRNVYIVYSKTDYYFYSQLVLIYLRLVLREIT